MVFVPHKKAKGAAGEQAHARRSPNATRTRPGIPLYLRLQQARTDLGTVKVPSPAAKREEEQTWYLHSPIDRTIPITAYAVPHALLTLDAAGTQPLVPHGAPGATTTPAAPLAAGTTLYGPNHLPVVVLGSDHASVIVQGGNAVHYAVGAGACVLVEAGGSWYLFDAGINLHEPHSLAKEIGKLIKGELGGKPLRAVFLTHGHYDHVALLRWIAAEVPIETIVANPRQLTRDEYVDARTKMLDADQKRRDTAAEELRKDTKSREEFVEKLRLSGDDAAVNEKAAEQAWREETARRVAAEQPPIREVAAVPIDGTNRFDTLDTRIARSGEKAPDLHVEDLLPTTERVQLRGVVDPGLRGKETTPLREGEVDRMSTTYVLTIDGRELVMMPDLRRTDLDNIRKGLSKALGDQRVEFREWVLGHHMQRGFAEAANAKTMLQVLELLHESRARGADGGGRNAVIASVDAKQVHAAHIRLLRLLGFQTFLAHSGADVRTYEVLAGAKRLRGVRGPLPPESVGAPTLERSIAKRLELSNHKRALVKERSQEGGKGSRARKKVMLDAITDLDTRMERISALESALVDAVRAEPYDDAKVREAESKLVDLLRQEKAGHIVTSSSHLTDTALVLLREPLDAKVLADDTTEGKARVRDLALREQKGRVALLREAARHALPEARQGAYAELYAELLQYKSQLEVAAAAHGPGVTKEIIDAELAHVNETRAQLEASFTGRQEVTRLPDGALVETKIVKIEPRAGPPPRLPSPAATWMLTNLERTGKFLGGVMMISTITGTKDLIERYESGQANLGQLGLGAARELTSGIVGLRMLGGAKVGTGVFVLISALEIGEALAGDYDYGARRDRTVDQSIRNGAITVGCMYLGEALIGTMNPIGIAAGAIIMFAGPMIINALLGDDAPESLYPSEVTAVDEKLVELLAQYRIITGGLELEKRTAAEREAVGLGRDVDLATKERLLKPRMRALYLESQIVPAFEAAYARTRGGRAGLRELDEMRRQFLQMRAGASTDQTDEEARFEINRRAVVQPGAGSGAGADPSDPVPELFTLLEERDATGTVIPIRELTLRRLEAAEKNLFTITADEVRTMEQWTSIENAVTDLVIDVSRGSPDWADIGQRQRDLEARLISAQYRVDPAKQAVDPRNPVRRDPLLAPGSDARKVYDQKLADAERLVRLAEMQILRMHFLGLRGEHIETRGIDALWNHTPGAPPRYANLRDRVLAYAGDALALYKRVTEEIDGPPPVIGGAEKLYREPEARERYRLEIKRDARFRKLLVRLEINETAALSLLRNLHTDAAQTTTDPDHAAFRTKVAVLEDRFLTLKNDRKERRGILFPRELDELAAREHQRAVAYYAPRLGEPSSDKRLTPNELSALQSPHYYVGEEALRRDVASRLHQVSSLRIPIGTTSHVDPSTGAPIHVSRTVPGIMRLDGLTSDDRLLVGVVKQVLTIVTVVPLNEAAIKALGGRDPQDVSAARLIPATEADLAP